MRRWPDRSTRALVYLSLYGPSKATDMTESVGLGIHGSLRNLLDKGLVERTGAGPDVKRLWQLTEDGRREARKERQRQRQQVIAQIVAAQSSACDSSECANQNWHRAQRRKWLRSQ